MANIFGKKRVSTENLETVEEMEGEDNMGTSLKYDYAAAIEKELKDMPLMFKSRKVEDKTRFEVLMPSERLQVLRVKMIVDEDGDIKLRCYLANDIDVCKIAALQEKLNQLNSRYRFICLSFDEDRDLYSAYDLILFGDEEAAVKQAITSLMLFADITDKCVPVLLPLTWKNDEEKDRPTNIKTNPFQSKGGAA